MPSSLTWLDHDEAARERSQRLLQTFRESETRDELGIGAIRDAIADQLFPGTSVIQTRLRYMLLVPWLFIQMEREHVRSARFSSMARVRELRLNQVLQTEPGAFGRVSGETLKRLASSVYWAGMGRWGIRLFPGSQQQYFRNADALYAQRKGQRQRDDGEWLDPNRGLTWHPELERLMPDDFPEQATLALTRDEAGFLREQWKRREPESLLSWLAFDRESLFEGGLDSSRPWEHPRLNAFPRPMQALLQHGRMFSLLSHGAALLYNLHLCEVWDRPEGVEEYRAGLRDWSTAQAPMLGRWKPGEFWPQVSDTGHTITLRTRRFVEEWFDVVRASGTTLVDSGHARQVVERREREMKGDRSRFRHVGNWSGASGLLPLTYRWEITRSFLRDLASGLEAA